MATSERAAPKDRPPLFLEGGIKSWAFAFLRDLSVWRRPSWQALVQRFEREERPDLIVLRASGRRTPSRPTRPSKRAGLRRGGTQGGNLEETTLWLSEDRAGERAQTNAPAVSWPHAS
jgi:hypothetical protein